PPPPPPFFIERATTDIYTAVDWSAASDVFKRQAWPSVKAKGGTGRPVAMLWHFLLNRAVFNADE
ncbi:hypothetical protein, partial [Enterobacter intestinihominis]